MSIGTTRNLTQQFIRLRNDAKRSMPVSGQPQDRATAKLLGAALDGSSSDIEIASSTGPTPGWVQKSERIRSDMVVLKERLGKLREAHAKALLVSFDSDNDSNANAEALTREIQLIFKKVDKEIQGIHEGATGEEDGQVRTQVQRQLAQALFNLTQEFRKDQTRFLNKIEAQKGLAVGSSIGLIESDSQANLTEMDPGFTQDQLARVDISTALVDERDREIRKIVETISELAQIMKDMAQLVVEQGTILDRIDYNIVQVSEKVEQGVQQLRAAEKTQKAGKMMLCILALIVIIVFLLIFVIIRHA